MRVCHITSVHKYNDTRITLKECKSLLDNGYEVHLIAPDTEEENYKGIKIHGVKNTYKSRLARMLFYRRKIFNKAIEIDAEVYHFHDPELIPLGLKLLKKGKKVIYDVHEDVPRAILSKYYIPAVFRGTLSRVFEIYENYASKKMDVLVTATPHIYKRFKKINKSTVNINNYPLLNELFEEKLYKTEATKKYVSYVGALGEIRGSEQLFKASEQMQCKLKVAGRLANHNLKIQIKNNQNIGYLGILDRDDVKNLLSRSIAGIVTFLPEPNHIYAQPNKLFEYMSSGIPVVSSNFELWKDIVENNNCGICVDPEKPEEIATAVNYLVDNPELAKQMGNNGRKMIEEKYNWEIEKRKLIGVYEMLQNQVEENNK